jgi:hypothetical protein
MCRNLNIHGYTDWYLPAYYEMQLIIDHYTAIQDLSRTGYPFAQYWTSNYDGSGFADIANFTYPAGFDSNLREYDGPIRCIRKPADISGQAVPSGCSSIGSACSDGTVYAGDHPLLTGVKLYTMTADDSSSKAYASASANTGADSEYNGRANQKWLAQNATISNYPAAETCKNSTSGGHNDWYLPSRYELNVLYTNRVAITGFGTGNYWSSTEASNANARRQAFNTGTSSSSSKTGTAAVRCIRKDDID